MERRRNVIDGMEERAEGKLKIIKLVRGEVSEGLSDRAQRDG